MASTILSDNGVSSGSAGLKSSADSTGVLALQTSTSGGAATTAVTIDTSQNVGIGTASPSYKVDVNVGSSGGAIRAYNTANTNTAYLRATNSQSSVQMGEDGTGGFVEQLGAYPLRFFTNNTEAMRITSAGLVGIGTSSPNLMLTVSGQTISGATGGNGYVLNASGSNYGFISNPSAGVWSLGYGTTPATLGTTVLSWSSSGYVTTPSCPSFLAYRAGGNTAISLGTNTLPLDGTVYNVSSSYSTSTFRFTAPVAGTYQFNLTANVYSTPGIMMLSLYLNTANYISGTRLSNTINGDNNITLSTALYLNANDYVTPSIYVASNSNISSGVFWNNFSGYLVG